MQNNNNLILTPELCEFVGMIIGDGYIQKPIRVKLFYSVSITGHSKDDKEYLTKFTPALVKAFIEIRPPRVFFRKDSNALILKFNSKKLFYFLTNKIGLPVGNKTFTAKIPDLIENSGEELLFSNIRGIYDTDGTVFFDRRHTYCSPYPRICLQTVSEPLFIQLKLILEKHFSIYTKKLKTRHVFTIDVYGWKQFQKWMSLIGFSNKKHLDRINQGFKDKLQAGIAPAVSTLPMSYFS